MSGIRHLMGEENEPVRPVVDCSDDPGRTKQSFAQEADINYIMARYHKTGYLVDPASVATRHAVFGDFSEGVEYMELQNRLLVARQAFERLPSSMRERFGNDPAQLIEFISLEENRREAEELGLLQKAEAEIPPPSSGAGGGSEQGTASGSTEAGK